MPDYKKKPKKPPFQASPDDASGVGGQRRRQTIDDIVAGAERGEDALERQRRGQHAPGNK